MTGWQILGWTQIAAGSLVVLLGALTGIAFVMAIGAGAVVIGVGNVWIWRKPR